MKIKISGTFMGYSNDCELELDNEALYYIARVFGNNSHTSKWIIKEMKEYGSD